MEAPEIINIEGIICAKCSILLEPGKVNIKYLASTFTAEILKCPKCGLICIPEDLALGKMSEVEKTLDRLDRLRNMEGLSGRS